MRGFSKLHLVDRFLRAVPLEKFDSIINTVLEKILRKLKLGIMRLDNAVGFGLEKVKKLGGANGKKNGEDQSSMFEGNGGKKNSK